MLNYFRDLYEGLMDVYRNQRDGPPPPRPVPTLTPTPSPLIPKAPEPTAVPTATLPAVKRWRHPFGDRSNPLLQLTQLGNAVAGYYPIGVNGMWHGGVHFDSGTAGIFKQDHVRCIADGEVVAYRIPGKTPKTTYFPAPGVTVAAPFASAFVLVRHRLEAPALEGSTDKPPSLIFFSLYMHLQDWQSYKSNIDIKRPAFWPEGLTLRVKDTANDAALGAPNQRGVNLLHQPSQGKAIGFLPRGSTLAVTGEGNYRKLKGSKGPQELQNDDGSLRGYIEFSRLQLSAGDVYSVAGASAALDVLAEADAKSEKLFKLPKGSEVTISGEGRYRKLESVAQYVQFASLERLRKPAAQNRVLVLEAPAPIKAGELIGHLGPYQENGEASPQEKLHLEVFTADDMKAFLAASRTWAARMPASEKTWLKIAGCVPVVTHQESFSATNPPTLFEPGNASTADLLVPKMLLDDLPPEKKIQIPAADGRNAINWYRLDNLLNDLDGKLLEGWVREEVGVTPWVNPWSWDGYDIIVNDDPPENGVAYVMDVLGLSKEEERDRNRPRVDASDKGPVKTRLYDIIDKDRCGKQITPDEMRAVLRVPAYAQSIAQLVIHYESEWNYRQSKWNALDDVLGHTTSAPILNWIAEKERIKQLAWWEEVSDKGVLPKGGKVYHLHPIGLIGILKRFCPKDCDSEVYEMNTSIGAFTVSKESFEFILEQEGYEKFPYVPGGASGVTIGYGYDLGQQTEAQVREDLSGLYSSQSINRLVSVVGKSGAQARAALSSVQDILMEKEHAVSLAIKMKKRYAQLVVDSYPEVVGLHPHCQGALLSLVVNRGKSFTKPDLASRLEMKQISEDLVADRPGSVPARIRSMKRLWEGKPGLGGLITRREGEAKLFERGLKCDC